jgi:hypothetical protein
MVGVFSKHTFRKIVGQTAIVSLLLILASIIFAASTAVSPLKRFWRPFLAHDKPIICITHPGAYYLSVAELAHKGDAFEAFTLSEKLQNWGRSSRIEIANDVSESDLKASPIVLIGGPRFNHWTNLLTQNLRFAFQIVDNKPRIVDHDDPARFWPAQETNALKNYQDYVVITRLVHLGSAKAVICIAGMTASSTRVGTQLIVNPGFLQKVLKFAPEDWDKKNLQFVVRTTSGKEIHNPELVAVTYW